MFRNRKFFLALLPIALAAMLPMVPSYAQSSVSSQLVTLNCTASPCPWGTPLAGHGIVWPTEAQATSTRLGYTSTKPVYLPASRANGSVVWINSGSAVFLAGRPTDLSHRVLATVNAGQFYSVSGLAQDEVLSVQSTQTAVSFTYQLALAEPPPPPPPAPPGTTSQPVQANCAGSSCPWGSTITAHALVWPASAQATTTIGGYTFSKPIFLSANRANGALIWIDNGSATLYAGRPYQTNLRILATLTVGEFYEVQGLAADEVLVVQSNSAFAYALDLPDPPPEEPGILVDVVKAYWRCNTPGCTDPDWVGGAVPWPSWAAYSSNARPGNQGRTVYSEAGQVLHTYMGSWAHGCDVTVVTGMILIIEWQYGTNNWRETLLSPGQRHVINLMAPENGAQIEGLENSSVLLRSCTPQAL